MAETRLVFFVFSQKRDCVAFLREGPVFASLKSRFWNGCGFARRPVLVAFLQDCPLLGRRPFHGTPVTFQPRRCAQST